MLSGSTEIADSSSKSRKDASLENFRHASLSTDAPVGQSRSSKASKHWLSLPLYDRQRSLVGKRLIKVVHLEATIDDPEVRAAEQLSDQHEASALPTLMAGNSIIHASSTSELKLEEQSRVETGPESPIRDLTIQDYQQMLVPHNKRADLDDQMYVYSLQSRSNRHFTAIISNESNLDPLTFFKLLDKHEALIQDKDAVDRENVGLKSRVKEYAKEKKSLLRQVADLTREKKDMEAYIDNKETLAKSWVHEKEALQDKLKLQRESLRRLQRRSLDYYNVRNSPIKPSHQTMQLEKAMREFQNENSDFREELAKVESFLADAIERSEKLTEEMVKNHDSGSRPAPSPSTGFGSNSNIRSHFSRSSSIQPRSLRRGVTNALRSRPADSYPRRSSSPTHLPQQRTLFDELASEQLSSWSWNTACSGTVMSLPDMDAETHKVADSGEPQKYSPVQSVPRIGHSSRLQQHILDQSRPLYMLDSDSSIQDNRPLSNDADEYDASSSSDSSMSSISQISPRTIPPIHRPKPIGWNVSLHGQRQRNASARRGAVQENSLPKEKSPASSVSTGFSGKLSEAIHYLQKLYGGGRISSSRHRSVSPNDPVNPPQIPYIPDADRSSKSASQSTNQSVQRPGPLRLGAGELDKFRPVRVILSLSSSDDEGREEDLADGLKRTKCENSSASTAAIGSLAMFWIGLVSVLVSSLHCLLSRAAQVSQSLQHRWPRLRSHIPSFFHIVQHWSGILMMVAQDLRRITLVRVSANFGAIVSASQDIIAGAVALLWLFCENIQRMTAITFSSGMGRRGTRGDLYECTMTHVLTMSWWMTMAWLLYATYALKMQWDNGNSLRARTEVPLWQSEHWVFHPAASLQQSLSQALNFYVDPVSNFS